MLIVITLILTGLAVHVEWLVVRAEERREREVQMRAFDLIGVQRLKDAAAKRSYHANLESVWLG